MNYFGIQWNAKFYGLLLRVFIRTFSILLRHNSNLLVGRAAQCRPVRVFPEHGIPPAED